MKTTLLIMAAGIGSRFGTGIKQLEPVDDAGHIIMDYSIHDAIEAGFNHVVFIIRKDIEKEFKEVIGDRIASMFFASTFSSKMQSDFLKVAWGISPVLHFPFRHSFRCRRGAVAGIQSLLVTDM